MGGGNGAKAAEARKRKQEMDKKLNGGKSQLKDNAKAMDIQCQVCKSTFLKTTRAPALTEHASNKHSKTLADCFPSFVVA